MITNKDISEKAFNMFRDFTKNVKKKYPDVNLDILDETVLVNDLINTINKARKSLLSDEKKSKRQTKGYDLGFMIGFIVGSLSVYWEAEYVVKQSEEYKQFVSVKSIRIYLELSTVTAIKIRNIYDHLLTNNSNIENINKTVTAEKLDELLTEDEMPSIKNEVLQTLHNLENNYIKSYLLRKPGDFLDDSVSYFTDKELTDIIEHGVNEYF